MSGTALSNFSGIYSEKVGNKKVQSGKTYQRPAVGADDMSYKDMLSSFMEDDGKKSKNNGNNSRNSAADNAATSHVAARSTGKTLGLEWLNIQCDNSYNIANIRLGPGGSNPFINTTIAQKLNDTYALDKDGNVVTIDGSEKVKGWIGSNANVDTDGEPQELNVKPSKTIPPQATKKVDFSNNLDAGIKVINKISVNGSPIQGNTVTASVENPVTIELSNGETQTVTNGTYGIGQSMPITLTIPMYDSVGNSHSVPVYAVKTNSDSTGSEWTISLNQDMSKNTNTIYGDDGNNLTVQMNSVKVYFDTKGNYDVNKNNSAYMTISSNVIDKQDITLDFSKVTQYVGNITIHSNSDGTAAGKLKEVSLNEDGEIVSRYSNGINKVEGKIISNERISTNEINNKINREETAKDNQEYDNENKIWKKKIKYHLNKDMENGTVERIEINDRDNFGRHTLILLDIKKVADNKWEVTNANIHESHYVGKISADILEGEDNTGIIFDENGNNVGDSNIYIKITNENTYGERILELDFTEITQTKEDTGGHVESVDGYNLAKHKKIQYGVMYVGEENGIALDYKNAPTEYSPLYTEPAVYLGKDDVYIQSEKDDYIEKKLTLSDIPHTAFVDEGTTIYEKKGEESVEVAFSYIVDDHPDYSDYSDYRMVVTRSDDGRVSLNASYYPTSNNRIGTVANADDLSITTNKSLVVNGDNNIINYQTCDNYATIKINGNNATLNVSKDERYPNLSSKCNVEILGKNTTIDCKDDSELMLKLPDNLGYYYEDNDGKMTVRSYNNEFLIKINGADINKVMMRNPVNGNVENITEILTKKNNDIEHDYPNISSFEKHISKGGKFNFSDGKIVNNGKSIAIEGFKIDEDYHVNDINFLHDDGFITIENKHTIIEASRKKYAEIEGNADVDFENNKMEISLKNDAEAKTVEANITINTFEGDNKITVEGANNTINTGVGKNTIDIKSSGTHINCGDGKDVINIKSSANTLISHFNPKMDKINFNKNVELTAEKIGQSIVVKAKDDKSSSFIASFLGVSNIDDIKNIVDRHNIDYRYNTLERQLVEKIGDLVKNEIEPQDDFWKGMETIEQLIKGKNKDIPNEVINKYTEYIANTLGDSTLKSDDITDIAKLAPKLNNIFGKSDDIVVGEYTISPSVSLSFGNTGTFAADITKNGRKITTLYMDLSDKKIVADTMKMFIETSQKINKSALNTAMQEYIKEIDTLLGTKLYKAYDIGKDIVDMLSGNNQKKNNFNKMLNSFGQEKVRELLKKSFGKDIVTAIDTLKEVKDNINGGINLSNKNEYQVLTGMLNNFEEILSRI